jgi:hypothetical protein
MNEGGRTHFPSKRDGWLTVVLWISAAMCLAAGAAQLAVGPGVWGVVLLIAMACAAGLVLWVLYGTDYTFARDLLDIRSGPFRFKVPVAEIVSVEPSRNPLSSPACSLDRLLIRYGSRQIMISPADRSTFLDTLARRNARLVRRGDRLVLSGGQ